MPELRILSSSLFLLQRKRKKNTTPPTELDKLFDLVGEKYNFNVEILRRLKLLKDGKVKADTAELQRDVENLLNFLREVIPVIDKMKV